MDKVLTPARAGGKTAAFIEYLIDLMKQRSNMLLRNARRIGPGERNFSKVPGTCNQKIIDAWKQGDPEKKDYMAARTAVVNGREIIAERRLVRDKFFQHRRVMRRARWQAIMNGGVAWP